MLTDKRLQALPDWIAPIAVDLEWRCRHEQYAVGRDVSHEAQQLRIIIGYADALLAHQQLRAIVEQLEKCEFECVAGPLRLNTAFIKLKEMVEGVNPLSTPPG